MNLKTQEEHLKVDGWCIILITMSFFQTASTFNYVFWFVVSTDLKNISQNGNFPQVGVQNKTYLKKTLVFFPFPQRLQIGASKQHLFFLCLH